MKYISILILVYTLSFGDNSCIYLFNRYNIDPTIKSVKGWKRVITHDKLHFYIKHQDNEDHSLDLSLSKCLIINGFEMQPYNRLIGKKL